MSDDYSDFAEDFDDDLPCDHENSDGDILTGLVTCDGCGKKWFQTDEEIARDEEHQREYDRQCAEWDAEDASRAALAQEGRKDG